MLSSMSWSMTEISSISSVIADAFNGANGESHNKNPSIGDWLKQQQTNKNNLFIPGLGQVADIQTFQCLNSVDNLAK